MIENPTAFPVPNDANVNGQEGMSLRDYTAIRMVPTVMQLNPDWVNYYIIASDAYRFADALLKARKDA